MIIDGQQVTENGASPRRVKRLRAPGHALTLEWSGETGAESSSTGFCACGGWEESAGSQDEVRQEYRWHLGKVLGLKFNAITRMWEPIIPSEVT